MKRFVKTVFYGMGLLFWLVVTALVLESSSRIHWWYIVHHNALVQQRTTRFFGEELETQQEAPALPGFNREQLLLDRMAFFRHLDMEDGQSFASLYGCAIFEYGGPGWIKRSWLPLSMMDGEHRPEMFLQPGEMTFLESVLPEMFHLTEPRLWHFSRAETGSRDVEFYLYPDEADARLLCLDTPGGFNPPSPAEATIWERPYFIYRENSYRQNSMYSSRTNNVGFRDDDVVLPKPGGLFRMLCIGGSTTEEGPDNAHTWPNLVEKALNAAALPLQFDVVNCGFAGATTQKEKILLPDFLALEPDVLLCYNAVNDLCHHHLRLWTMKPSRGQRLLAGSAFLTTHANRLLLPPETQLRADIRNFSIANLAFIREYAAQHGVQTILCTFAAPEPRTLEERDFFEYCTRTDWGGRNITFATYRYLLRLYNEELRAYCRREGVPCLELAQQIHGGAELFIDICHMKNQGIEEKAAFAVQYIKENLEEISGNRYAGSGTDDTAERTGP